MASEVEALKKEIAELKLKIQTSSPKQENAAFTQSSKEYALMGREVWSSFECSAWADTNDDEKEQQRLFLFGYERGKIFLGALRADKIDRSDLSQEVPIVLGLLLHGPSDEFILGQIYSSASGLALEEVYKTGNNFNLKELQKTIAGKKFRDGNCQLIGK